MSDPIPYIIGIFHVTGAIISLFGFLILIYDAFVAEDRRSPGHITLSITFLAGCLFQSLLTLKLFISPSLAIWYWLVSDLAHLFGLFTASCILILALVLFQVRWMYKFPFIVPIPFLGIFFVRIFYPDSVIVFEVYYIVCSVFVTFLAATYYLKLYAELRILNHGIYITSSLVFMAGNIFEILGGQMQMLELVAVGAMLQALFFVAVFATTLNLADVLVSEDVHYA
ncbi:MAG: hypothetical protein ACFFBD_29490 [Candidatus Hodarchaeota archaeon]